jgi:hypothetical protein
MKAKAFTVSTLAILLTFSTGAFAQVSDSSGEIAPGSANGQRNGDSPGTNLIPGAPIETVSPMYSHERTGTINSRRQARPMYEEDEAR